MAYYYVFGGPKDPYGTGVRFTSIVKARAYAIRMLDESKDRRRVSIYNRNSPHWIEIPKSAQIGQVGRTSLRPGVYYVWYYNDGDVYIDRNGKIKRGGIWE